MFTYEISESITGKPVQNVTRLATRESSWERLVGQVTSGSTTFSLAASPFSRAQHRTLFMPWTHQLNICWNRWPIYSGLITQAGWTQRTKRLTVKSSSLRILLSRRLMFPVGGWGTGTVDAYSLDIRRAMALFVRKALLDGNPRWKVPLTIIGHVGGSRRDTVHNDSFQTAEDIISALEAEANAPDIDFRPRRVPLSDYFEHEVRIGDPANGGLLDGPSLEWARGAQDVKTVTEGIDMVTGAFTPGEGSEQIRPFGQSALDTGLEPYQGPYLDKVQTFSRAASLDQLDAFARAIRIANSEPRELMSFTVRSDGRNKLDQFMPGMRARALVRGDEWLPPGWSPWQYVLGYSGGSNRSVTLKVKGG
ncbi:MULTISPECIES: hypothetical protein [unclassified Pseudoclavibacter]|uniref:hypothetical protein n=1 Tax=unclassified Pseudoclavibacter TaxID=2615177 RepID=UPI001BA8C11D|nr:hypothetical protein [Pseudoclavibacter sp. Marseille-Q4354]MBS3177758.1 hypothetical protein [Pseudoclavibacter sp. Marseille-Q4354]